MIVLDVWALAVLLGCALIARRHARERSWTMALLGAAVAVAALLGEWLMVGRPANLTTALLLTAPALLGVFVVLPYLTVVELFVTVGPRLTARLRGAKPLALGYPRLGRVDGAADADHRRPGPALTTVPGVPAQVTRGPFSRLRNPVVFSDRDACNP